MRIGPTEYTILAAIVHIGKRASSLRAQDEVIRRTGKRVAVGALYTTTARMAEKGFVTTAKGAPSPWAGGKAQTYFTVTEAGHAAIKAFEANVDAMRVYEREAVDR